MSEEKFYRCIPELNKECKKNNCYINGGYCEMTICKEYSLKGLLEEIERLNNFINELEKWLKYKKEQMEEFEVYKRKETGAFWYSTLGNIETFIERIQELKGSDKE